eukprot:CAMPEP_0203793690 /NCGR_PEP_ID=MMETSP0100_2-20121128/6014_1 /ASSEMBLY_ACC=CAM_ASM_000210 /TAXON_ID=96639 /ORGANISM=" , Strain NY0313808BC1" /LENGTH=64 /DNA_ID=CAMNT_0050697515 /DNA_START=641 /DNA_END=835 /DNA_ORIENTATION=-
MMPTFTVKEDVWHIGKLSLIGTKDCPLNEAYIDHGKIHLGSHLENPKVNKATRMENGGKIVYGN